MVSVTGPGIQSFSNLQITAAFELIAGATILIPAGRLLVYIYSGDGNFDDIRIEIQSADGWEVLVDWGLAGGWAPSATRWNPVPMLLISDGVNFRLRNTGVNPVPGIQYWYMEI